MNALLDVMLACSMMIVLTSAAAALAAAVTEHGEPHMDLHPAVWKHQEFNTSSQISEMHHPLRQDLLDKLNDTNYEQKITHTMKLGRRQKRMTQDVQAMLATQFNLIGIVTSIQFPIIGAIPLIIGTILPFFFPGGEPVHSAWVQWAETVEMQRLKMIGFKDTMQHIERLDRADVQESVGDLRSLYYSMNNDRSTFMHSYSIKSSAAYFKQFAMLHLAVNDLLIESYTEFVPNPRQASFFSHNFGKNLREYIAYASYAIQQEPAEIAIRSDLEPSIANWTRLLSRSSQEELKNRRLVFYNKPVAFKVVFDSDDSDDLHKWLSCWEAHRERECHRASCPCHDNPMKRGPDYDYYGDGNQLKCRGEIFEIRAIDPTTDDIVRTCDRVGIFYMRKWGSYWSDYYRRQKEGEYWWLSVGNRAYPCSGEHASSMRNGGCVWEAWRIEATGKPCNVPIIDRDKVQFVNAQDQRRMFAVKGELPERCAFVFYVPVNCVRDTYEIIPSVFIFKSDLNQGDYYRDLPSLRRPGNC